MAERPIFVPASASTELVKEIFFQMKWHSGFAPIQKEKNIDALHAAAAGFSPLLEVSSKSKKISGQHLSAFHLKVQSVRHGEISLECAFQGSEVFERGGPFADLYNQDVREAKRDPRLRGSGPLTGFQFDGFSFPLEPKTVFYDWLYINSIYPHREWCKKLYGYAGFTDIEFNPYRSINCQARSCALFLTLMKRELLDAAIKSPEDFIRVISGYDYRPQLRQEEGASRGRDYSQHERLIGRPQN
jgi:uncharacterized protein DUF6977